jgi:hypothetical protein
LATLLIFIHIEHVCSFFVAFFSATIDGRNLIFGHKLYIGTPFSLARSMHLSITLYEESSQYLEEEEEINHP